MRAAYSMMRGQVAEAIGEGGGEGRQENVGDRKRKSGDDGVVGGVPVDLGKSGKDMGVEDKMRVGRGERGGDGLGLGRIGGKRRIREATPDKVGLRSL